MQKNYQRRSNARIQTMLDHYNFQDKNVLDIGCSKGYVTNALKQAGANVVGIDSDLLSLLVARNKYKDIPFICSRISFEQIKSLGKCDCVLLLAVLHHVLVDMGCYQQDKIGLQAAVDILSVIREKTDTLWFEIALPNEVQREGTTPLTDMGNRPNMWIIDNLLSPAGFDDVIIYPYPELRENLFQAYLHKSWYKPLIKAPQLVRDLLKFDDRDARPLFQCR